VSAMFIMKGLQFLAVAGGLAVLAGCGTAPAGQPGAPAASTPGSTTSAPASAPASGGNGTPGPASSPPAPPAGTPGPSATCPQAGIYLTAIRTSRGPDADRVVFEFSGGLPTYGTTVVKTVYSDAKGDVVPLAGQVQLRLVFHGATAWCPQPARKTYAGPSPLTPFYPQLLAVSAAGDFERVLSFGIGLAAPGSYHSYALTSPYRVVLDVSHVALGKFPGIWDITSWQQYWQSQYAWNNGHQPWLGNPAMVVQAWARGRWPVAPVIRQVSADTFQVTEPGGRIDTVTGTRPVTVPGPWVITKITHGASR
jgi:hypothetical protein